MNALDLQPMNARVVSQQGRQNGDDFASLEVLESGRMWMCVFSFWSTSVHILCEFFYYYYFFLFFGT